jgi:hypothetical protein
MEGEVGPRGLCLVGSWEVSGAQLVAGWGLEVVERGEKGGVQILQRFALGFPKIFQAKKDKGAVVLLL